MISSLSSVCSFWCFSVCGPKHPPRSLIVAAAVVACELPCTNVSIIFPRLTTLLQCFTKCLPLLTSLQPRTLLFLFAGKNSQSHTVSVLNVVPGTALSRQNLDHSKQLRSGACHLSFDSGDSEPNFLTNGVGGRESKEGTSSRHIGSSTT